MNREIQAEDGSWMHSVIRRTNRTMMFAEGFCVVQKNLKNYNKVTPQAASVYTASI